MKVTRTAKWENGRMVYDPPFTPEEEAAQAERFAEMCELRQPPGTKGTDRAFMEGHHTHGFTDEPEWFREMMVTKAKAAGVNIQGKKYVGGLADGRGPADPLAWVSDTHDVIAVCKKRNKTCRGHIEYQGQEVPPKPDVPLAEPIVKRIMQEYVTKDPSLKMKPKQELREMVIDHHGTPSKFKGRKSLLQQE